MIFLTEVYSCIQLIRLLSNKIILFPSWYTNDLRRNLIVKPDAESTSSYFVLQNYMYTTSLDRFFFGTSYREIKQNIIY